MSQLLRGNASEWIAEGRKIGTDLSFLLQDKTIIYQKVQDLGLPTLLPIYFSKEDLGSQRLAKVFREKAYFCRLLPKDSIHQRKYRLTISSVDELNEFCREVDMNHYSIQLSEQGNVTHTGGIIAQEDACIVELVEGLGPDLFHGTMTPLQATAFPWRTIEWSEDPSEKEERIIRRALRYIGWPRHAFPGYFEFSLWDETQFWFRNYQPPDSMYAKI